MVEQAPGLQLEFVEALELGWGLSLASVREQAEGPPFVFELRLRESSGLVPGLWLELALRSVFEGWQAWQVLKG